MRCANCGQDNRPGLRLCTECGTELPRSNWEAAAAPTARVQGQTASAPTMPVGGHVPFTPAPTQAWPPPPAPYAHGYPTPGGTAFAAPEPGAYGVAYPAPGAAAYGTPYGASSSAAYGAPYAAPGPSSVPYGYPAGPVINNINNINVAAAAPPVVVMAPQGGSPPLALRALYFLFIGLWLGTLWTVLAWLLIVSILGLPLGLWMINRLPLITTLKPSTTQLYVGMQNGVVVVGQGPVPQRPFLTRALYFTLVGWWASGLWLLLAWVVIAATVGLGLPLAFWMFNRVPAVTTLAR